MAQTTIRVLQAGLACCGVEAAAVDLVTAGLAGVELVSTQVDSAGQLTVSGLGANVLVVAGTVTHALVPQITHAYESLAEPKKVIAFGVCAITGGPYWDSYSVVNGAQEVIPVDVNVPGCPPRPEDLARAFEQVRA